MAHSGIHWLILTPIAMRLALCFSNPLASERTALSPQASRKRFLLSFRPLGDRVDHLFGGQAEGPYRVRLGPLILDDDGIHQDILPGLVKFHPAPGSDQLIGRHIGLDEGLADGLWLSGTGSVSFRLDLGVQSQFAGVAPIF
jgi:hypothetical protein